MATLPNPKSYTQRVVVQALHKYNEDMIDLDTFIKLHTGEETEWQKQAKAVPIPTPGDTRTYTEIMAELEAGGVFVPPGIKMLASGEQSPGGLFGGGALRFRLDD
ncbi:MAG: hypothetical protein ACREUQ_12485 [Burkholderiales bacterium]